MIKNMTELYEEWKKVVVQDELNEAWNIETAWRNLLR